MNTYEAMRVIADRIPPHASLVVSLGRTSEVAWHHFNDRALFLDSMGDVAGVACGLALGLDGKFPVVAFDTDGGQLMGLHWLPTVAPITQSLSNLLVVIFDNELYESAGSVPSRYFELDWRSLGHAFQLDICTVSTRAELKKQLVPAFTRFMCVVAKIHNTEVSSEVEKTVDGVESKYRFVRHLECVTDRRLLIPAIKS